MNWSLLAAALGSVVRHGLTIGAGYLVAQGHLPEAAGTALVGLGWSLWLKYTHQSA